MWEIRWPPSWIWQPHGGTGGLRTGHGVHPARTDRLHGVRFQPGTHAPVAHRPYSVQAIRSHYPRTTKVRVAPVKLPAETTLDVGFWRINVGSGEPTSNSPPRRWSFIRISATSLRKARRMSRCLWKCLMKRKPPVRSSRPRRHSSDGDSIATSGAIYLYNELTPSGS